MAKQGKSSILFLALIVVVALATAGLGYLALQKEKQNNVILSEKISDLEEDRQIAENKISDLSQQLGDVQKKLNDYNARIVVINEELAAEKKAKEDALSATTILKNELDKATSAKADLEEKLKASEGLLSDAQKELATIKNAKETLEQKLKSLESKTQSVQLDKIVVFSPAETAQTQNEAPDSRVSVQTEPPISSSGKAEGKVLVVNGEYDFIVVDLGRMDNVSIGTALDIFRKNKKIGRANIEEVRDTMSVASPASKGLIKQIKEDDRVVVVTQ